jgi:NADH-quinone oxidoreductase subunit G
MIKFEVNEKSYYLAENGLTVLQACEKIGLKIPRFCYHEKLTIAGNCRMCLVEIANPKTLKPVASCALPLLNQMNIFTNTILVKKAREGVLEFLLCNHPLDCPICDQGGECDLQDQALIYGSDRGRFYEERRVVEDKDCGPLIKTVMTRCIHCTRCVRFASEIGGVSNLGVLGRGSTMEIGLFINNALIFEFSGHLIDLCPVGALTSKPYSFLSRPWELKVIETIDILDVFLSKIRVEVKGKDILRILPSLSSSNNLEWINDKSRFCYDGLLNQRISFPILRLKNNTFIKSSFSRCFFFIFIYLQKFFINEEKTNEFCINGFVLNPIFGLIGNLISFESILILQKFLNSFNSDYIFYQKFISINDSTDFLNFYFIEFLDSLEHSVDFFLLCYFNPRLELPLLNLKLRKNVLEKNTLVVSFGYLSNLTYNFLTISGNFNSFLKLISGQNFLCKKFLVSKFPLFLLGKNLIMHNLSFDLIKFFSLINKYLISKFPNWEFFKVIINFSGLLNFITLGNKLTFLNNSFSLTTRKKFGRIFFCLGTDTVQHLVKFYKNDFLIYFGHNGDEFSNFADLIFPTSNIFEKNSTYINLFGKLCRTQFVVMSSQRNKEEWEILSALFIFLIEKIEFNNVLNVDRFCKVSSKNFFLQVFAKNFNLKNLLFFKINTIFFLKFFFFKISNSYIFNLNCQIYYDKNIINFYQTDSITKVSEVLTLCTEKYNLIDENY